MGKYKFFNQGWTFPYHWAEQNPHLRVQVRYVQYIAADIDNWDTDEFQAKKFQDTVKFKWQDLFSLTTEVQKVTVISKCTGEGGERRKD